MNKSVKTPAWLLSNHPQSQQPLNRAPKNAAGAEAEEIPHNTFPTSAVISSTAPFHTPFQLLSRPQQSLAQRAFICSLLLLPGPQPESPRCHRGVTRCSRSSRNSRDGIWIHRRALEDSQPPQTSLDKQRDRGCSLGSWAGVTPGDSRNSLRRHQQRFKLEIRGILFPARMVRHWNAVARSPGGAQERCGCGTWGQGSAVGLAGLGLVVEFDHFWRYFPTLMTPPWAKSSPRFIPWRPQNLD